jgi:predicted SprT family Zn-dependent metalloprotease
MKIGKMKCFNCGCDDFDYECELLEEWEREMRSFKHLKGMKLYKCKKCGVNTTYADKSSLT